MDSMFVRSMCVRNHTFARTNRRHTAVGCTRLWEHTAAFGASVAENGATTEGRSELHSVCLWEG